jgi:hypothetical protein
MEVVGDTTEVVVEAVEVMVEAEVVERYTLGHTPLNKGGSSLLPRTRSKYKKADKNLPNQSAIMLTTALLDPQTISQSQSPEK